MSFLRTIAPWSSFEVHSFFSADSILIQDHKATVHDIQACLTNLYFTKSELIAGGGGLTAIGDRIETDLHRLGYDERNFTFPTSYDDRPMIASTHKVDGFKNRVAIEVEWNNKDTFYDRDLLTFALLHHEDMIDLGVIITRSSLLKELFKRMVLEEGLSGSKFCSTTTHSDVLLNKLLLLSRIACCPTLVLGITDQQLRFDAVPDPLGDIISWAVPDRVGL